MGGERVVVIAVIRPQKHPSDGSPSPPPVVACDDKRRKVGGEVRGEVGESPPSVRTRLTRLDHAHHPLRPMGGEGSVPKPAPAPSRCPGDRKSKRLNSSH